MILATTILLAVIRRAGQPGRRPALYGDRSAREARLMAAAAAVSWSKSTGKSEQIGLWQDAWQRFRRNPIAVGGLIFVCLLVLDALLAPLLVTFHLIPDPLKAERGQLVLPGSAFTLAWDRLPRART